MPNMQDCLPYNAVHSRTRQSSFNSNLILGHSQDAISAAGVWQKCSDDTVIDIVNYKGRT